MRKLINAAIVSLLATVLLLPLGSSAQESAAETPAEEPAAVEEQPV